MGQKIKLLYSQLSVIWNRSGKSFIVCNFFLHFLTMFSSVINDCIIFLHEPNRTYRVLTCITTAA